MSDQTEKVLSEDELWDQAKKDREPVVDAGSATVDAQPTDKSGEANLDKVGDETSPAPESKPDDPLAGLPEPTRALLRGLQEKQTEQDRVISAQKQALAKANGTIGNLKQRLEQRERQESEAVAAEKRRQEAEAAEVRKTKLATAKEKLNELDLGEVAELLPEQSSQPMVEPAPDKTGTTAVQPGDENKPDDATVAELKLALHERVPGWTRMREEPEFVEWAKGLDATMRAKFDSWDVDEAASVFEKYQQDKKAAADSTAEVARLDAERKARLQRGDTVMGRGSGAPSVDTSPDGIWNQVKRDRERARSSA